MPFTKIQKPAKEPKILLTGPSGSGKTQWALTLASAVAHGPRIALLDTESGRGRLFLDVFDYLYAQLEAPFTPQRLVEYIHEAYEQKANALIVDSATHFWADEGGVLDMVRNAGKNQFTDGWGSVGTPAYKLMMGTIVRMPFTILCTARTKSDYVIETNERGKAAPREVGTKVEQRDGFKYDFDFVINLGMDHAGTVTKLPPIAGLATEIPPHGIVAWAAKMFAWMREGTVEAVEPETWEELKLFLDNEKERQRGRELFMADRNLTPQQVWHKLKDKPAPVIAAPATEPVPATETVPA